MIKDRWGFACGMVGLAVYSKDSIFIHPLIDFLGLVLAFGLLVASIKNCNSC